MISGNDQAEPTPTSEPVDQPDFQMYKIRGVTHVSIMGDSSVLMPAFGTKDFDFLSGLIHQVCNASAKGEVPDELAIKFMLAFIKSREPRDEIEAALLAQMAATHVAAMRFAHRLGHAESPQEHDSAERTFNRLLRTFAALASATGLAARKRSWCNTCP
jgi:hypothetical protein